MYKSYTLSQNGTLAVYKVTFFVDSHDPTDPNRDKLFNIKLLSPQNCLGSDYEPKTLLQGMRVKLRTTGAYRRHPFQAGETRTL